MEMQEFKKFIQTEMARIEARLTHLDPEKRLLAYTLKESE